MTQDTEIAAYLTGDATLMGILTGGVYAWSVIGPEGLRRGNDSPTKNAFDADGFLEPCAIVRMGAVTVVSGVQDLAMRVVGNRQVARIWYYQDRGDAVVIAAKNRVYALLQGHLFTATYPAAFVIETEPVPDSGPVKGSTTLRQDWEIVSVRRAA